MRLLGWAARATALATSGGMVYVAGRMGAYDRADSIVIFALGAALGWWAVQPLRGKS